MASGVSNCMRMLLRCSSFSLNGSTGTVSWPRPSSSSRRPVAQTPSASWILKNEYNNQPSLTADVNDGGRTPLALRRLTYHLALILLLHPLHEPQQGWVVRLNQVQQVESPALVLGPAVVLHYLLVQLEYLLPLLVFVYQEGPPIVLVRIFEETHLLVFL